MTPIPACGVEDRQLGALTMQRGSLFPFFKPSLLFPCDQCDLGIGKGFGGSQSDRGATAGMGLSMRLLKVQ